LAGPTVYICDECVNLCNDIVEEDWGERLQSCEGSPPGASLRESPSRSGLEDEVEKIVRRVVHEMLENDASINACLSQIVIEELQNNEAQMRLAELIRSHVEQALRQRR
jgi:hypothetical protein